MILVSFEAFSAIIALVVLFTGGPHYITNLIYVIVLILTSVSLVYGMWMGRSWAWWIRLILSLIGLVVWWPTLFYAFFEAWIPLYIVSYLGHLVAIILYLLRPEVKAFFNIQAVGDAPLKVVKDRLPFIDFTRGIVMILMAWDHVSGFWNLGHRGSEGLLFFPPDSTTAIRLQPEFDSFSQFMARFITHWCAPTFIFLAGTALALSTTKRLARGESQRTLTLRIIKRGALLLFFEAFVVAIAFELPLLYFGVLACIGVCFIIFSVLRRAPPIAILILSIGILLAQPFLDLSWMIPARLNMIARWYLKVILYQPNFQFWPYFGLYPIIPWLGVMGLGWCFGVFLASYDHTQIKRLTLPTVVVGGISLGLWFVVRLLNGYGNGLPRQGNTGNTIQDWLYMAKYPPSLAFLLWTLGGMCFFLTLSLYLQDRPRFTRGITGAVLTLGRVPLFFYCTHLWLYRLWPEWMETPPLRSCFPGTCRPIIDLSLAGSAIFWVVGLVILWRMCLWYEQLKWRYPDSLLKYI